MPTAGGSMTRMIRRICAVKQLMPAPLTSLRCATRAVCLPRWMDSLSGRNVVILQIRIFLYAEDRRIAGIAAAQYGGRILSLPSSQAHTNSSIQDFWINLKTIAGWRRSFLFGKKLGGMMRLKIGRSILIGITDLILIISRNKVYCQIFNTKTQRVITCRRRTAFPR